MKGIKIYDQIYDVIGGECYCGGPILECTETCCPSDSDDYCPKSEVQQIKDILTKYDHLKKVRNNLMPQATLIQFLEWLGTDNREEKLIRLCMEMVNSSCECNYAQDVIDYCKEKQEGG